ncbi:diguanylate cyclase [Neiella marina]|uniref:histidine kinase n=1 Tax=Neiella marina TaxID=508461 RepID=A0A8J2UA12_9GAMM|nr:GAF domain-containing sensor histidine kinase [Neiella marina]GGA88943.1 diguanylate cyclase [Neiella marina]
MNCATFDKNADYWQRLSRLEAGRAEVLKFAAQGESIDVILNFLCAKSEEFNPAMKTSVLALNDDSQTLHPLASVSLPKDYCDALEGVAIGLGVGSCGSAAFSKKRVVVEDINTHPYWSQYKPLALKAGLQACWSEPIIGSGGKVYGTFAIYYGEPQSPTAEDIQFIETSANLAAVVFENWNHRQQLLEANRQLSQTVDDRNKELEQVNSELSDLVRRQRDNEASRLEAEKQVTVKTLLTGIAHELNTPLGTAMTAISCAQNDINGLLSGISNKTLSQSQATALLASLEEKFKLTESNLYKSSQLIQIFKQVDSSGSFQSEAKFDIGELLTELKTSYRQKTGFNNIAIEVNSAIRCRSRYTLWQILSALVDNSLVHGFNGSNRGHISIGVSESNSHIHITYHDDGIGIAADDKEKVFEPFYSPNKTKGKMGLGLNIIRNIIYNAYNGSIKLVDSPVGVRFQIALPK